MKPTGIAYRKSVRSTKKQKQEKRMQLAEAWESNPDQEHLRSTCPVIAAVLDYCSWEKSHHREVR